MGLGGQLTFWPPYMIKRLQDSGYRPIAYDNRDMGLSTRFNSNPSFLSNYLKYYLNIPIKSEYKLDDMANDAVIVIDYLNIKKTHVIRMAIGAKTAVLKCWGVTYSHEVLPWARAAKVASRC